MDCLSSVSSSVTNIMYLNGPSTPNTIPISPTPSSPLRMSTMGDNMERSNLYLKLFKLVFGSVTLFAQENELMLKVSV